MLEVTSKDIANTYRSSSKGDQLKFVVDDVWYKVDRLGYEGAAEYVASVLLKHTQVPHADYTILNLKYKLKTYTGCASHNLLKSGQDIITVSRLLDSMLSKDDQAMLFKKDAPVEKTICVFVETVQRCTGLISFGKYLTLLLELDALTLNEDRHLNNVALLRCADGTYNYCPIFDNGAAYLSDTQIDYPLGYPPVNLIRGVKSKPFSSDFDKQVKACRNLYGQQLYVNDFDLSAHMGPVLEFYGREVSDRILSIYDHQRRIYPEMFV